MGIWRTIGSRGISLQELLGGSGSPLMRKDVEQEIAECEALQQRVWSQRVGELPLKVYQAIGKASAPLCMHTPDPCSHMHRHPVLVVTES